jgi:hypothetical protein
MGMDQMGSWGVGMMITMSLLALVVLAGVIGGVLYLARGLARPTSSPAPREGAQNRT